MKRIVFSGNEPRVRDGLEVREPGPGKVAVRIGDARGVLEFRGGRS